MADSIQCDKCGHEISLDLALKDKVEEKIREMRGAFEKEKKLFEDKQREFDQTLKAKLEEKMEVEKRKIWELAKEKANEKFTVEMKDLKESLVEKEKKVTEMQEAELKLRKKTRELEDKEKNMKLDLERQLDEEKRKIEISAKQKFEEEMKILVEKEKVKSDEESRLKILERDKQLEQLKRTIEDLKRKSEQGSMQIQGDVQENDLKRILEQEFPIDVIADVPTGVRGADLIQTVKNKLGQKSGTIIWESKNTKSWTHDWLKKLKDDQALIKADVAVLISKVLPDGVESFKFIEGVWVCDYKSALDLTAALRMQMIEVSSLKSSMVGRDEKMEVLYNYLGSAQFKNKIENIVRAFQSLKDELEREKRSFQRIWSRREKEIERVMTNTVGMYGDLEGLIGGHLAPIDMLELEDGE